MRELRELRELQGLASGWLRRTLRRYRKGMTDPLSLFPLALAASGGRLDGIECQQLVAAGLTLLRRSAPLVRALSGRRSGILVPNVPALIVALAASDGRGAVVFEPASTAADLEWQLSDANVGAVFTTNDLATRLPGDMPLVLLDDAPRFAQVRIEGNRRDIDLGSHVGLELEGSLDAEGLDEECVVVYGSASPHPSVLTHRQLIAHAGGAPNETLAGIAPGSPLHDLLSLTRSSRSSRVGPPPAVRG